MVLPTIYIINAVSSVGALWTIASISACITRMFTDWCVIYSYYVILLSTEKLLRLAMKMIDERNMLYINISNGFYVM